MSMYRRAGLFISLLAIITFLTIAQAAYCEEDAIAQDDTSSKLDTIINNQKMMLDEIRSMKQELSIIKIRVTQQQ